MDCYIGYLHTEDAKPDLEGEDFTSCGGTENPGCFKVRLSKIILISSNFLDHDGLGMRLLTFMDPGRYRANLSR